MNYFLKLVASNLHIFLTFFILILIFTACESNDGDKTLILKREDQYHYTQKQRFHNDIKKAKYSGKFNILYYTRKLHQIGEYMEGKESGLWVEYFYNGLVKDSCHYVNGMKDGRMIIKDLHGKVVWEETYKDDKLDGPYREYYENGKIQSEGYYRNGNRDGVWKFYCNNDSLVGTITFDMNMVIDSTYCDSCTRIWNGLLRTPNRCSEHSKEYIERENEYRNKYYSDRSSNPWKLLRFHLLFIFGIVLFGFASRVIFSNRGPYNLPRKIGKRYFLFGILVILYPLVDLLLAYTLIYNSPNVFFYTKWLTALVFLPIDIILGFSIYITFLHLLFRFFKFDRMKYGLSLSVLLSLLIGYSIYSLSSIVKWLIVMSGWAIG